MADEAAFLSPRIPDEDEVALVERWLEAKGVTLWADWTVTHPKSRRLAAVWFAREMESFAGFVMELDRPPADPLPGPRCPVHTSVTEPCSTCSAYIAAGL
jgi:hypothetical protein